jgi:hypothetical protein
MKNRCLTCDREIKSQSGGNGSVGRHNKGVFLPKLESALGAHGSPGGPGFNAAEIKAG